MAKKPEPKEVNVTEMVDPKFLSLVELPANQIAFKVVREDETKPNVVRRRIRRSENSPLLMLVFSENATEEIIQEYADTYGLSDYEVVNQAGCKALKKRGDLPEDTFSVTLSGGIKAVIARGQKIQSGVVLSSLEFDSDCYDSLEEVEAWIARSGIDISKLSFKTTDTQTVAVRCDNGDKEIRRIKLDAGVNAVIYRDDVMDVPQEVSGVVEAAYGCYGWGQLDFGAALADIEFCEAADEALEVLENVSENILFYNDLPLQQRKALLQSVASQFASYLSDLMSALPVAVARSEIKRRDKEKGMTKKEEVKEDVKVEEVKEEVVRSEETVAETVVQEPVVEQVQITREDIQKMVSEAVAAALAAQTATKEVVRSEEVKEETPVDKLTAAIGTLVEQQKEVITRLDKIESTTVVRSDVVDTQSKKADPFSGLFSRK